MDKQTAAAHLVGHCQALRRKTRLAPVTSRENLKTPSHPAKPGGHG